ncbi:hypothetical protein, partial [Pseudomonas gingeri]
SGLAREGRTSVWLPGAIACSHTDQQIGSAQFDHDFRQCRRQTGTLTWRWPKSPRPAMRQPS